MEPSNNKNSSTAGKGQRSAILSSIPLVPVTVQRKPFRPGPDSKLIDAGTARASIAASEEAPDGTTREGWPEKKTGRTVLQQHCDFFDLDNDGVIFPSDTYRGFYRLGFGIALSLFAAFIIHSALSYPTLPTIIPDPLFRIYTANIHKDKHGSDSGSYDTEGRFVPQKFEDIFSKYAEGRDSLSLRDVARLHKGNRLAGDPFGWTATMLEWLATYILLWPADGRMKKEDIRGVYDGSIFYVVAERRAKQRSASS
jgi:hypothetical protein